MGGEHELFLTRLRAAFPRARIDATGAFRAWGTTYCDGAEYRAHLDGKCWDELDPAYLDVRSDALGFLETDYFVGVLPAYLEILVTGGPFTQTPYMLLLLLTAPGPRGTEKGLGRRRFTSLVDALSPSQRRVVAEALEAFATRYAGTSFEADARRALASSWSAELAATGPPS